jgi:hypothetical protein
MFETKNLRFAVLAVRVEDEDEEFQVWKVDAGTIYWCQTLSRVAS